MASAASRAAAGLSAMMAATASPTNRTSPCAKIGRGGAARSDPSGRLKGSATPRDFNPAAATSSPVRMASTPGRARAALVSIETMRAWAWGERRKTRCAWPGRFSSLVKRPVPAKSGPSSSRRTAWPLPKRPIVLSMPSIALHPFIPAGGFAQAFSGFHLRRIARRIK